MSQENRSRTGETLQTETGIGQTAGAHEQTARGEYAATRHEWKTSNSETLSG